VVTFLFIAALHPDGVTVSGPPAIELEHSTPAEVRLAVVARDRPVADVPVVLHSQDPAYVVPPTVGDLSAWFTAHTAQTDAGTMSFVPEHLHASTDARGQVCAVLVATGDATFCARIDGTDLFVPVHLRES